MTSNKFALNSVISTKHKSHVQIMKEEEEILDHKTRVGIKDAQNPPIPYFMYNKRFQNYSEQ